MLEREGNDLSIGSIFHFMNSVVIVINAEKASMNSACLGVADISFALFPVVFGQIGMEFEYIMYSKGESIDPCSAPLVTRITEKVSEM